MAQLNMMNNQWSMGQQGWPNHHNFNGSNMSLNMPHQNFDQPMWNPWMQQQQQQFPMMPMMPGGDEMIS